MGLALLIAIIAGTAAAQGYPSKPGDVDAMLKREVARWAQFVKDAKIEAR